MVNPENLRSANQHRDNAPSKGHERPLASMIRNHEDVRLDFLDGKTAFGMVTHFDNTSITLELDNHEHPTVVFKHSLKQFRRYDKYIDEQDRTQLGWGGWAEETEDNNGNH